MQNKKKRGGARKGAGRPPSPAPAIRKQITLPEDVFEMLERQRGDIPRSTFIQYLIIEFDKYGPIRGVPRET